MKLIVEMEMPKDCLWYEDGKEGRCPFLDDGDCCRGQSDGANEVAETWSDLQKGCPIKGVLPEEHGDLIDRDELKRCWTDDGFDLWVSHTEIYQQPIVIAAERKKE